jgi:hypothetical protein
MKLGRRWTACIVGMLIMIGVYIDHYSLYGYAQSAEKYHAHVKDVVARMPISVGDWICSKTTIPEGAEALLRPNVTISRDYVNLATGQRASFLLVQCRDARDLIGHYPPVCYAAHGYVLSERTPREWTVGGDTLNGTMYQFKSDNGLSLSAMKVYDVMVLPNNKTTPDMAGVDSIARDRKQRYFGAAQIQIITAADMSATDQAAVISSLLESAKPVIDAIRQRGLHE